MFTIDKSHKLDDVCYDIHDPVHKSSPSRRRRSPHHPSSTSAIRPRLASKRGGDHQGCDLNMPQNQGYCDSKRLGSARKAVIQYHQQKGCAKVDIDDIYIGNGARAGSS